MDAYMQCLYDHITGRLAERLREDPGYRRLVDAWADAGEALEAGLSPEQSRLLDRCQCAEADMLSRENETLFLEGVALGRWLTSQTASP